MHMRAVLASKWTFGLELSFEIFSFQHSAQVGVHRYGINRRCSSLNSLPPPPLPPPPTGPVFTCWAWSPRPGRAARCWSSMAGTPSGTVAGRCGPSPRRRWTLTCPPSSPRCPARSASTLSPPARGTTARANRSPVRTVAQSPDQGCTVYRWDFIDTDTDTATDTPYRYSHRYYL